MDAILLGLLQGLTEFLPISSSGHLVIAEHLLDDWHSPGVLFEVLLHLGTLGSICVFYRKDIAQLVRGIFARSPEQWALAKMIVVGSVPTAFIGLLGKDFFEEMFSAPRMVGVFLLITACALVIAKRSWSSATRETMSWKDALIIGTIQGFAILPGISRSGSTVACALLLGVRPDIAARYSFLLSIPAVAGATLLQAKDGLTGLGDMSIVIAAGLAAFISGLIAIKWFVQSLISGKFLYFAVYCAVVGLLSMTLF